MEARLTATGIKAGADLTTLLRFQISSLRY